LAVEVALAIVGDEEGADGAVFVEGEEPALLFVEAGDDAIGAEGFEDVAAFGGIAEFLGEFEILLLSDFAEFAAVLLVVVVVLAGGAEALREESDCAQEEEEDF